MDAGEQLIDRLDARADPRRVAQAVDGPRACLERRIGRRERRGHARSHDGQLALLRGDRAAAHRGVEQLYVALRQPRGEITHEAGRHRAREHHGCARRERRCGAVLAEQHSLHLGVVQHHDEQQLRAPRGLGRGGRLGAPALDQTRQRLLAQVMAGDRKASAAEARRHAEAHRAQPDEADFRVLLHGSTFDQRLRACRRMQQVATTAPRAAGYATAAS